MAEKEYIEREDVLKYIKEFRDGIDWGQNEDKDDFLYYVTCLYHTIASNNCFPAADVVERKALPEDVEDLVKDLYGFAKECTDSDMCKDCQLAFMCEDGWPPNAIAHLIETWSATHKAMAKQKTGKWILPNNKVAVSLNQWICSECNYLISGKHNYCPNCGSYNGGDDDGNQ